LPEGDNWLIEIDEGEFPIINDQSSIGESFGGPIVSVQEDRQGTWPYAAGWSADGTNFTYLEPSGEGTRLCCLSFADCGSLAPAPASVIIPQKQIIAFSVSPTQNFIATTDSQGHIFVYPRKAKHEVTDMEVVQNRTACLKEATRPGIDAAWLASPIIRWASDESVIAVKDGNSMVAWHWPSMHLLWPAQ
jgi:hypothetical protein